MHFDNKEIFDYLENVEKKISRVNISSGELEGRFISAKTKLSQTGKQARVEARIDALIKGKVFDESDTPSEELNMVEEDMINGLAEREMDELFGE